MWLGAGGSGCMRLCVWVGGAVSRTPLRNPLSIGQKVMVETTQKEPVVGRDMRRRAYGCPK